MLPFYQENRQSGFLSIPLAHSKFVQKITMDQEELPESRRDQIEAENAVLRLKLELEHNLSEYGANEVPPEIENIFLQSIYTFEQQHANSRQVTVFERMGKPRFRKLSELHPNELPGELQRLYDLLRASQIVFDCICEYDDGVIYKFITEELFEKNVDSCLCQEMLIHFTYEEFHLNHDYELRRITEDTLNAILRGGWCEFDAVHLYHHVNVRGKTYDLRSLAKRILEFQEMSPGSQLLEFKIDQLKIDEADNRATSVGTLSFDISPPGAEPNIQSGPFFFQYTFDSEYWEIIGVEIYGIL